jgi:hypothetical protein
MLGARLAVAGPEPGKPPDQPERADELAEAARVRREAAAAAYERGVRFRAAGEHAKALAGFEEAYAEEPLYKVLYDIGAEYAQLRQWAAARRAFEQYLDLGKGKLSSARSAEVQGYLEALEKRTATLTLKLNVVAEVRIDGKKPEQTPVSKVILEPGTHVVRVSKPGFQPVEETVNARTGETLQLVVPLALIGSEPGAAGQVGTTRFQQGPVAPDSGGHASQVPKRGVPLWVPWTVTGALATGWVTTAAFAIKARHDRNIIERPGTSAERIDDARRLHITLAVVSDVLLACTLASAGVSAYYTWWAAPQRDAGRASVAVSPEPGGLSLSVGGRF